MLPLLERYEWPGNIRELRNTVERMAILSAERSHHRRSGAARDSRASRVARRQGCTRCAMPPSAIASVQALEQTDWNVAGAARLLGIERTNLHKRMKALGLNRDGA